MRNLFTTRDVEINLKRMDDGDIILTISSEYSYNQHKQQLYVDEKRIAMNLERFWKSIKTKKLWRVVVNFFEIDWYDDYTDVYEYPYFTIKRGLKKARTEYDSTGSIPKDWGVQLSARFHDTTAITPLLEVVKLALPSSWWSAKIEADFRKAVRPLLQKKAKYVYMDIDEEDLPRPKSLASSWVSPSWRRY